MIQQKSLAPPPIQGAMTDPNGYASVPWVQWITQNLTPRIEGSLQSVTLSGDVVGSGGSSFSVTIQPGVVTLAKMAPLAATSIMGNNGGAAAAPQALTPAQVAAMLPAGGDLSGTYDAPTVTGLRGKALPILAQGLLGYSGTAFSFTMTPDVTAYKVAGTQVVGAQQAGLGAALTSKTAAASYGTNEQTMLQQAHDKIRILEGLLRTHGLVTT